MVGLVEIMEEQDQVEVVEVVVASMACSKTCRHKIS